MTWENWSQAWSNLDPAPTLTLERLRQAFRLYTEWADLATGPDPEGPCHEDHVELELVALARAGDEAGFRELAACVMPESDVRGCWEGTRSRLGLSSPPPPCPVQPDPERLSSRAFLVLMDDPQDPDPLVSV